jgi:hypothetical protein
VGKRKQPEGVPQFKVVVTRPNGKGPLGPYRLAIAVGFAALVAGGRIWTSVTTGPADDGALLAAAGAAVFAWVLTTVISNILGAGEVAPSPSAATGSSAGSSAPDASSGTTVASP